jgi:Resolvase, N terminal domain/Recombinase
MFSNANMTAALGLAVARPAPLLRRRRRRADTSEPPRPRPAARLLRPLFVAGTCADGDFQGRVVAVAVEGPLDAAGTRYLVEDRDHDAPLWVSAAEVARSAAIAPGARVIGYVTVRDGASPRAARAARAASADVARACDDASWRLVDVVMDGEYAPPTGRPGFCRALERIAAGDAAGLVVADLDRAAGSDAGLAALTGAVRRAGGDIYALAAGDRSEPAHERRAARAEAARRIAELRADGMSPQAIADALNAAGVPTPGREPRWQPWTVRQAGGAWPARGPRLAGHTGRQSRGSPPRGR